MKIGNSPELQAYTKVGNERTGASDAGRAPAKTAKAEAGSQVELSSAASSLIAGAAGDDGSFDTEKVQRIADAISKGQFTINSEAIADKLIANASEMVARATPH
ncbi:flagellar biosynthesis anti-sigma factor FlgM [Roseateles amylovorans]|uniref:Negative regulator of flagellin synthesis n=1 Tax=Roseateles amylovorans TaxID=2978473 RepID=A0ABY6B4J2_9BURK|nr:flagellar biosynthesis anti-sigma factor FlgM [Roseateles amylovorans]UXH79849.1 flagellar biosynthesis anti-sigma factor FlgM [Roseateles amylovorans]